MTRKKRLGRGLEALLNSTEPDHGATAAVLEPHGFIDRNGDGIPDGAQPELQYKNPVVVMSSDTTGTTSDVVDLSVYEIEDNPFQPCLLYTSPSPRD